MLNVIEMVITCPAHPDKSLQYTDLIKIKEDNREDFYQALATNVCAG